MRFFNFGSKDKVNIEKQASTAGDAVIKKSILEQSQGNPGAMRVLMELYKTKGAEVFLRVAPYIGKGPEIWEKFKDECGENLDALIQKYGYGRNL